jgi:hypothetical protein
MVKTVKASHRPRVSKRMRNAKQLVWLYFILLIFEGALRKWFLTDLSDILLVVRDPIALLIYFKCLSSNKFLSSPWIASCILFSILSLMLGLMASGNLLVTAFGIRTNFLHLPMIFAIAYIWDRGDVQKFGRILIYGSIGMSLLTLLQFYSPNDSWLRQSAGGIEDEGIMGAKGRFRPSGTFSFVVGLAAFYPLVFSFLAAAYLTIISIRPWHLVVITALTVISCFASISRTAVLAAGLVILVAIATAPFVRNTSRGISSILTGMIILAITLPFSNTFNDAFDTFAERWDGATDMVEGEEVQSVTRRFIGNFTGVPYALQNAPSYGVGIGMGSNVAAFLIGGSRTFTLAEGEFEKCIYELGPFLGIGYLGMRVILFFSIGAIAIRSLNQRDPLPLLIFTALGLLVLFGQWSQPTIQGFAVFGGGLVLASSKKESR